MRHARGHDDGRYGGAVVQGYSVTGTRAFQGALITTPADGSGNTTLIIAPSNATITLPTAGTAAGTTSQLVCPLTTNPVDPSCGTTSPAVGVGGDVSVPDSKSGTSTRTITAVQAATALGMDNPQQFADLETLNSVTSGPTTAGAFDSTTGSTYGAPALQAPSAQGTVAAIRVSGTVQPLTAVNGTPYGNPICYAAHFDGGRGYIQACSQRYRTYVNGGDWWFVDKYHGSAKLKDTAIFNKDKLTGIRLGSHWQSGNAVYDWAPAARVTIGSCRTVITTVSVGVFNSGVSSSESHQVCPSHMDPDLLSPTSYGSHWSGSAGNGVYEEDHGDASIHNPASAGTSYGFSWYCWWD